MSLALPKTSWEALTMRSRVFVLGTILAGAVFSGAGGCTVKRSNPVTPGEGLTVAGDAVSVDPSAVPVVSGACAAGHVVTRGVDGWACAPPSGPAGPTGPTGTSCDSGALAALQNAVAALQADVVALQEALRAQCPLGFEHDTTEAGYVVCQRTVWGATDKMVKVGNFWIDRYEASICPSSGAVGAGPAYDTSAWACSTYGVAPQANVTWFQAAAMCANAGKRLCTNAEWQTAVSGTPDPGPYPVTSGTCAGPESTLECNTCAGRPGAAGNASNCKSRFGAYDLIGNYYEWVADWFQAGQEWKDTAFSDGKFATPWPAWYGDNCGASGAEHSCDGTYNLDGRAFDGTAYRDGMPAAAMRGGFWNDGASAGAFTLNLIYSPMFSTPGVAGRCCVGQ
jgi:hypothetical protein